MKHTEQIEYCFWRLLIYELKYPRPDVLTESHWFKWLPLRCRVALNVVLRFRTSVPSGITSPEWSDRWGGWYDEIPF